MRRKLFLFDILNWLPFSLILNVAVPIPLSVSYSQLGKENLFAKNLLLTNNADKNRKLICPVLYHLISITKQNLCDSKSKIHFSIVCNMFSLYWEAIRETLERRLTG